MTQVLSAFADDDYKAHYSWKKKKKETDLERLRRMSVVLPYWGATINYAELPEHHFVHEDGAKQALAQQWGVPDVEALRGSVDRLLRGEMHTPIFDLYLPLTGGYLNARADLNEEQLGEFQQDLGTFIQNLAVSNPILGDPNEAVDCFFRWQNRFWDERFVPYGASLPNTTRAWDIVRAAHISYFGVLAGYFEPAEHEDICRRAVAELRKYFNDWSDVAASFWWGRAIWAADDEGLEGEELETFTREYFDELHAKADVMVVGLTAKDSPWLAAPLHAA